ncbi:MAG TPA: type II secretion system protein GspE, partial [Verrucomicrobia bacterium]|nr:type II secretion system protein GspE [Verrucomicrobiota bacterium]
GYKGRTGIHELLAVSPAISEAIRTAVPPAELLRLAVAAGFRDMLDDGADKILAGATSVAEVLRSAGARRK